MSGKPSSLRIGWGHADFTPQVPVIITGQFHPRVSEGVRDPVGIAALAIESTHQGRQDYVIFATFDLVAIPETLRQAVHENLKAMLPEIDPLKVILHATHTHTGPEIRYSEDTLQSLSGDTVFERYGVQLDVEDPRKTAVDVARQAVQAIVQAWTTRRPGGISYGLSHATVGCNRRMCYYDGPTVMYGQTNDPNFSHIEGNNDSSVNLLYTWDDQDQLTGVAINLACPSQNREQEYLISADYWCETRRELRGRLGETLHILSLNSPSGDLVPAKVRIDLNRKAEDRMRQLAGRDECQEIAHRIADAVTRILPVMRTAIERDLPLVNQPHGVDLPRRTLSQQDVDDALKLAEQLQADYETLIAPYNADPSLKATQPRWYVKPAACYRRSRWNREVARRFEKQKTSPTLPIHVNVVRLGDIAFATNPFEYYLDYAHQIKARSSAVQTFLVQHVGTGTYLPTQRAVQGGSYGAVPASTPVGPEGGRLLAQWTVQTINVLFPEK